MAWDRRNKMSFQQSAGRHQHADMHSASVLHNRGKVHPGFRAWPCNGSGSSSPARSFQNFFCCPCLSSHQRLFNRIIRKDTPKWSVLVGNRRRPTLPGRFQPSTIGAEGLNFCVRDENRWGPFAFATGSFPGMLPRSLTTAQLLNEFSHFCFFAALTALIGLLIRNQVLGLLVTASCMHYCTSTAALSPGRLPGALLPSRNGNLFLEVGFTLRCLQRLSFPYFASLLCAWQHNSCTSGTSIPVLSY